MYETLIFIKIVPIKISALDAFKSIVQYAYT